MSPIDRTTPFAAVDPADWDTPTPHIRFYRPDQRWRVAVNMATGHTSVFSSSMLFQRDFLTRGSSGGLVPVREMSSGKVDMLSYAVAVFYNHAGNLDRDMEELGLSLQN